jgi:hypothetical protein
MTISIHIEAHPDRGPMRDQIDSAMEALGFHRELMNSTAPVGPMDMNAVLGAPFGTADEQVGGIDREAHPNWQTGVMPALADIDAAVLKPASTRVRRRTKAEIAEDDALAHKQAGLQAAAAAQAGIQISETGVVAEDVPLISTGEERVDPNHPEDSAEVQAADAADEAAETAATKTALTLDDVRRVVGLYVTKYGMQAAADPATIIGCKMVDIPDTQEALAEAIAKVEQATEANPFERAVVGAAPKAATIKTATKDDVNAALLRYAAKYDGTTDQTKMPFTMEDGPRCLSRRFGADVRKASQIPANPESYAQAVADIEEMIAANPFKRTAPVAS